jgi:threonine dehydrogenase-like Zn-dependent dehydrogenase
MVKDLSQGGVKAVIDFVGAPATAQFGLDVTRKGGTLVMVGQDGSVLSFPLPFFPQRALVAGSFGRQSAAGSCSVGPSAGGSDRT